jgi:beta-N-acetylhexosaminidase
VTYARRADLGAGTRFNNELAQGVQAVNRVYVNADDLAPNYDRVIAEAAQADVIVIGSYVNISSTTLTAEAPRAFSEFVTRLSTSGKPVVLISFGTPYLLNQVPSVKAYAVAWGGSESSQRAAALALLGVNAITGRLPTSIPPYVSMGEGIDRKPK